MCARIPLPPFLSPFRSATIAKKHAGHLSGSGLPYREEPHVPLLHRLATKRNERGTVPVLVSGGSRFVDSTDILVHADAFRGGSLLYPKDAALRHEVDALEEQFDTQLGPHTRRWAYQHLLSNTKMLRALWAHQAPRVEARFLPVIVPLTRILVRAAYKITPESARRSLERVQDVFKKVEQQLSDGRPFLVGPRFTAADLTFAALSAPVLFPVECRAVLPELDAVPRAMREEVLRFRNTTAGRFALRLFLQERDRQDED